MLRSLTLAPLLALALSALPGAAEAGPRPAPELSRCMAPELSAPAKEAVEAELRRALDPALPAGAEAPPSIPIAFHILLNEAGTIGRVSDEQIALQVEVLNDAYAGCGLSFYADSIERTYDDDCYVMTLANEVRCKGAIQADPNTHLNVYSATLITALGWAWFPWTLDTDPERDGVVIHFSSMAGGTYEPYHLGHTATHEVGHWVGLYHTFEGGCGPGGDMVPDTPAEREATSGCPLQQNTCPSAGADPIHNFMDYSDDACMETFSGGQCARMETMLQRFRPGLYP